NLCDMISLVDIAKQFNLLLIEDATESMGSYFTAARYKGQHAATIGDIGVISFNGNKIITTGGGGMIVAKDSNKLGHMRYLSQQSKNDELRFIHDEIGYNYRMTNLQAALGIAQLEQLDVFIATKKRNYEIYLEEGLELLPFSEGVAPNYWFYGLVTHGKRDLLIEKLNERNIGARPIWELMHRLKPFTEYIAYEVEKAQYFHREIVNIPCSSNLTEVEVRYVASQIKDILNK
ncbi:MAG: DegT/DnrJ/EryC1/StrS family aminotransferase, partial [Oscillospiraceae bacterium]|nr:DegT/DnrJ/EryC1/StrS family aminotransferase [Oscillospiraceae bacterium]